MAQVKGEAAPSPDGEVGGTGTTGLTEKNVEVDDGRDDELPLNNTGGIIVEYTNSSVGDIKIELSNHKMLPTNPSASVSVALSVVKSIRNLLGQMALGV